MEFTELEDYPIPAGVLTEWLPCVAADAWSTDPRPVSYVHEAHLRRTAGSRYGDVPDAWLGTAFEVAGRLEEEPFRRALERWIDRHEPLRSQVVLSGDGAVGSGGVTRRTAPPGAVSVRFVRHLPSAPDDIREHLEQLLADCTEPHTWPAYVFATLEPEDGDASAASFTVFFAADHAVADAYSVVLVAHEITALYEQERSGRPAGLFPVGSYIDFGAAERADAADLAGEHEAVRIWREALTAGGGAMPEFPLPLGPRPAGAVPQRRLSMRMLDDDRANRFAARCREAGHGFFAGTLACLARATVELAGVDRFRTIAPSHTRSGPMWAGALGWFVGLRPVDIDAAGATDFATLTARAGAELRRTRASARVPFDLVGELLEVPMRPRFLVSYMDVRFVPMAAQWPQWNARTLRSRSYTHDVFLWFNRSPKGVNLAGRFPDTPTAAANVPSFVERVRELMHEASEGREWDTPEHGNEGASATGR
ncbi:condensation domain-containing protein [Rhodococcus aetherivorans]|uniref:Condensation domain-containing protein n=1 Tax=Rhodococcus aetherivorans TaxID=191292 RepID=A0AA46NXW1_9NOCA|nr:MULTISPECIES: condensation domain-containing protein [Rhodococcus]UGQ43120.1 condensation domain-containing protein [Rhodococcus aetherivorans]USC13660.1 condensation protein [Rhodococcus sp. 11-3]UYF96308.1 condensation domain-containing protein [Rhodococcus aetherivorans]